MAPKQLRSYVALAFASLVVLLVQAPGIASAAPLSIAIQGNQFVDGAGQPVRLLGVNHPSFEYACAFGYAYNDGNMNAGDAAAIASWHANAVRVPLNEDCWLGINGLPSNSQNPDPPLTVAGYRQAVQDYVAALNAAGLYVILDLHWTAPQAHPADGQRPMPDGHSVDFWNSVASVFKSNPAVVFDVFNEPYSPAAVNGSVHGVDWNCWKGGGCSLPSSKDSDPPSDLDTYQAVGMQTLVNTIRATGATQPILLGGLSYANDLSDWLANEPADTLAAPQLAASFHNYQGQTCSTQQCWDGTIAPVAARVPVVTGEFDQDVCQPSTFDESFMSWADLHGVGYLAWGWWVLSAQEISDAGCSAYYLITDPTGTPAAPNGTALHDHLARLAGVAPGGVGTGGGGKGPALRGFKAKLGRGGKTLSVVLRADQDSAGVLSGRTVKAFAAKQRHRRVSLGSVRFKLKAGKAKRVVLKLSKRSRKLLTRRHTLKVQITVALTNSAKQRAVTRRTLALRLRRAG
jgi:endoglucanase